MDPVEPTPIDDELLAALLAEEAAPAGGDQRDAAPDDGLRECLRMLRTLGSEKPGAMDEAGGAIRFGRFTIEEELGRGGFGIVYRARDPVLGRSVALKVPRPELMASAEVRRRFLREARAAGGLDHPNIVPVLDAGPLGPVCFIASAYCPGPTLARWLKERTNPVPPGLAARMIADLAAAIRHAHERGVLHRDIKPSNVILSPDRAKGLKEFTSEDEFTPRLTDFGLAKLVDDPGDETRPSALIGSPPYMAPEQAAGRNADVGPATDVHALGAVLYELLVGRPPFLGESRSETLRLVIEAEPAAPRTLRPRIPRDLEVVVLACLAKEPSRRYASAAALAEDLERHLDGRPILARPPSAARRALARARRHPTAAAVLVAALAAVVGFVGLLAWSNARQRDAIARLEAEKRRADALADESGRQSELAARRLRGARLLLAGRALDDGRFEHAQTILEDMRVDARPGEASTFAERLLRDRARRDVVPMFGHARDVEALARTPDGRTLVSGDWSGEIRLWNLDTGEATAVLKGHSLRVVYVAFSADGRRMVSAANSYTSARSEVVLWDLTARRASASLGGFDDRVVAGVGFEPGNSDFWVHSYGGPGGGSERTRFDVGAPVSPRSVARAEHQLHVAPNGRAVELIVDENHAAERCEVDRGTGRFRWDVLGNPAMHVPVATSGDSRYVAAAPPGEAVVLRDLADGAEAGRFTPEGAVLGLVFDAKGRALAAGCDDGTVRIWTRGAATPVSAKLGAPGRSGLVHVFAFSDDGTKLAVSEWGVPGGATPVTVREAATGRKLAEYPGRRDRVSRLVFAPDGRSLFIAAGPAILRWRLQGEEASPSPAGHADEVWSIACAPDGGPVASGSDDDVETRTIKFWNPATGDLLRGWNGGRGTVSALSFSPDGRTLASGHLTAADNVRLWDAATGRLLATFSGHVDRVRAVVFQPGGSLLASAGSDPTIRLWDVPARRTARELKGHSTTVQGLAFAPDGRTLASAGADGSVRLWEVDSGACLAIFEGAEKFTAVACSPDGTTIAAADEDGEVALLSPATLVRTGVIRTESGVLRALAFAPDGRELAAAGEGGSIEIWEHRVGQRVLKLSDRSAPIRSLAFSSDGRTLVAGDHAGGVVLRRGR